MKKYSKFVGKDVIAVLEPINSDDMELIYVTKENLEDSLLSIVLEPCYGTLFQHRRFTENCTNKLGDSITEALVKKKKRELSTHLFVEWDSSLLEKFNFWVQIKPDGTEILYVTRFNSIFEVAKTIKGSLKNIFLLDMKYNFEVLEEVSQLLECKVLAKPNELMIEAMGLL